MLFLPLQVLEEVISVRWQLLCPHMYLTLLVNFSIPVTVKTQQSVPLLLLIAPAGP
jgi:hypothetical protein